MARWSRWRVALALSVAVWLLGAGVFVVSLAADAYGGNLIACGELTPGSSDYGSAHFDWSHLGESCSWDIPALAGDPGSEGTHTESSDGWPDVIALSAWGGTIALLGWCLRRRPGEQRRT